MTTLQKALIGATIAIAMGTGIFEAHRSSELREEYQALEHQKNSLAAQVSQMQHERDDATRRLEILSGENEQMKSNQTSAELLNLRSKVTQLEAEEKDPFNSMAKDWLVKVNKLKQRLEETPGAKIPELQFLKDEDWLNATKNRLSTEVDYRRALASLRTAGEDKFAGMLRDALVKYGERAAKKFPSDVAEIAAVFRCAGGRDNAGTMGNHCPRRKAAWAVTPKLPRKPHRTTFLIPVYHSRCQGIWVQFRFPVVGG